MGSYDGAETCELVGCYLLAQLQQLPNTGIGLYSDDGLAATTLTPKETERIKKQICNVFKNNNLKITIEANKKVIYFLDVTLGMNTEKCKAYAKPTNTPLNVNSKSNHPPSIIKNIPESVNRRLSEISSDAGVFDEAAKPYQEALGKSGYSFKLKFKSPQTSLPTHNRSRNIIWFNLPYNRNVKSNIQRQFLRLIDQSFPVGNKLRKIFNRNTLKLSYSCMRLQRVYGWRYASLLLANSRLVSVTELCAFQIAPYLSSTHTRRKNWNIIQYSFALEWSSSLVLRLGCMVFKCGGCAEVQCRYAWVSVGF